MIFKDIYPAPPLDQFVQLFRIRHFIIPPNITVHPKPYTPRPEQCMTFYARGYEVTEVSSLPEKIRKPRSVMSGQYTQMINRYACSLEFLMILVVFKPGALHRLTGISFNELVNQHVDLEDVFPAEGRLVNERLNSCSDYHEMLSIIQRFLISLIFKQKISFRPCDEAFDIINTGKSNYSLAWLANQACLSPRQFERISKEYLGISPQLFARLARFNESYKMRLLSPKEDWLSIALHAGIMTINT